MNSKEIFSSETQDDQNDKIINGNKGKNKKPVMKKRSKNDQKPQEENQGTLLDSLEKKTETRKNDLIQNAPANIAVVNGVSASIFDQDDHQEKDMSDKLISVWVLNSKGGVGKTTLSVALADHMMMADRNPKMAEIDSRKRLSSFMGTNEVESFEGSPSLSESRKNPNMLLAHYDPIVEVLEQGNSLIDLGANEDKGFLEYCTLSRLDEDMVEAGIQVIAMIPTVTESESVRGAFEALQGVKRAMPSAQRVLVFNERDGSQFDTYLTEDERAYLRNEKIAIVQMNKILSEGWEDFQRAKMRFTDVIRMDTDQLREAFSFQRTKARRARGDIAAWFAGVSRQLEDIIPSKEEV